MWRKFAEASSTATSAIITGNARWGRQQGAFVRDPLVILVSGFACLALLVFTRHFLDLLLFYSKLLSGVIFLLVCILAARAILKSPAAPLRTMARMALQLPVRLYLTVLFALLFLAAFTTFKINIPAVMPFYADPWLASLDAWLHGTDPWRIARSMPAAASIAVDFVYSRVWFGVALGSVLYVSIVGSPAEYRRMIWSTVLIYCVLGVLLATALSSVGPVFYDYFYADGRFRELVAALDADDYASGQKMTMDYLYSAFTSHTASVGTGISAMPSIHVAIAVLTAWYLTAQGRVPAAIGWAFASTILFGSIYTGWHYAVDGYLSAILSTAIWLLLSRFYRLPIFKTSG